MRLAVSYQFYILVNRKHVDNTFLQSTCDKSVDNLQQTCHQKAMRTHPGFLIKLFRCCNVSTDLLQLAVCRRRYTAGNRLLFLGFTRVFCSKSGWGSTRNALMIMLYYSRVNKSHKIANICCQTQAQHIQ